MSSQKPEENSWMKRRAQPSPNPVYLNSNVPPSIDDSVNISVGTGHDDNWEYLQVSTERRGRLQGQASRPVSPSLQEYELPNSSKIQHSPDRKDSLQALPLSSREKPEESAPQQVEFSESLRSSSKDLELPPPSRARRWVNLFLYDNEQPRVSSQSPEEGLELSGKSQASVEKHLILTMRRLVLIQLLDFLVYSCVHYLFHIEASHVEPAGHDDDLGHDDQHHEEDLHESEHEAFEEAHAHDETALRNELFFGLVISLLITGVLLASVATRRLRLIKYVIGLTYFYLVADQVFILSIREHIEPFEIAVLFLQNFFRATIALLVSQFLMNKALKLLSVLVHYLFSIFTFYCLLVSLHLLEEVWEDHQVDVIQLAVTIAFIEYIIFIIFDTSHHSILASSLYITKCQEQTTAIIQNLNTGIITREKQTNFSNNILFCNRQAMQLMGGEGHWEEFRNQDGDIISPDNEISKDRLIELIQGRQFFEYNQDKVISRSSSQDLAFSVSDFFKMSPRRLQDTVFYQFGTPQHKFVKISKDVYVRKDSKFETLEMRDVSKEFLMSQGEKRLLSLINATVSHEMRTPINSINSQNIETKYLIGKISDLTSSSSLSLATVQSKLSKIHGELERSNRIHHCSTKFLTFEINDMLDYSQLKQGKFRKVATMFDAQVAIQEILTIQEYKAEQMGIQIKVKFDGFSTTGDLQPDYRICTDEQRFQQILINLLSNALKFTPSGGFIFIYCRLLPPDERAPYGRVQVSVQDTGIGIKEEDQGKLFKLFGYLDTTKELNTKGIGLGLHICQMITTFFGGEMTCESEYGHGAKFDFSFCLDDEELGKKSNNHRCKNPRAAVYPQFSLALNRQTESNGDNRALRSGEEVIQGIAISEACLFQGPSAREISLNSVQSLLQRPRLQVPHEIIQGLSSPRKISSGSSRSIENMGIMSKRILVTDDEPFNIQAISIMLKQAGSEGVLEAVDFAKNGQEAIDKIHAGIIKGSLYGLVFMDCSMPVKDGFEAADEIHEACQKLRAPRPKIVACTGHCEQEFIEKAWRHKMDEFISKPIRLDVLKEILTESIIQ